MHLLPPKSSKISMFCALSQNYQHLFEKKIYASYSKLSKEIKNSIKIKVGQAVLELLTKKQHFDCSDLQLKNHLVYLNFNVIFEFLEHFFL